ncbi:MULTISPECIES: GntR family transcriptional regulator [Rhizobium/Agrobacterium group]|nr:MULTISPECIES: GntR family transcriptional regulator [Rhizobium/Agrobacterium group]MCZ7472437.1 GntR family transcriptional regulator [Rhizobium rhizogenes]MCZ7483748.1 GntR family transcriptional regulator [Rhizobium rhizogenes]MCZ7977505.1 GntR family transcriptional regulator [Agrobacterium salinitolerans]MEB3046228.1 GntR family transcriptional regulator [Rhizobium sp. MJ21]WHO11800.1 GntR family transcriptional regulator [Agrobacterium cucumeris]
MKVQDTNLREQVFSQIRGEIIAGHAPPGSMYSVPTIAESFGTSSTPVREALLELVRLGLLEPHKNRGFRVTSPSVEETRNIFDMREVLEVHAAIKVAKMPKKNLGKLERFADQIAAAVETKSFRAYLMADREFHHVLTSTAGNPILTDTVFSLRDRMRFYGDISEEGFERQKASVPEHYRIVELVNSGDAEELSVLLKSHIRSWEPLFMKAVKEKPRAAFSIGKS